jgi:hypothetical protein
MDIRTQIVLENVLESGDPAKASAALDRGADPNGACHALDGSLIAGIAVSNCDRAMIRLLHDCGVTFD